DQALADEIAQPMLRRVWRARVARFADWFLAEEAERRANLLGTFAEVPGEMTLAVPPGFTLTARADRIDLLPDGQAAIYDYKASAPPSHKQIELGFNHQLHLQAAILAAGGFDDLPAAEAALGAYLGLTGQGAGGAETRVDALHAETARHLGQVGDLLTAYSAETKGYTARRALLSEKEVSDYDHLSRFGEWETGDG
ncbi:MAG: PD-(D/E)XK nuclease family protein, partial [Pseudomonadota bacterium]